MRLGGHGRRGLPNGEALRALRRRDRRAYGFRRAHGAGLPQDPRRAPGLQDRGHLRGGVPHEDRLPLQDLRRRRVRSGPERAPARPHPGRGPQPHRPGHRVRLLLRARQLRAGRRRVRDHHGELQPRDGLHRLRHLRHAVLRAAHLRGRHGRHRRDRSRRRRGHPRRSDAAEAGPRFGRGRGAHHGHEPGRHRSGRGPRPVRRAARFPRHRLPALGHGRRAR